MRKILNTISKRSSIGLFLFALLTVMIFSTKVQKAWAYFTTYVTAKGGYTISLGDTTTTDEHYVGYRKVINIKNSDNSKPVWVRVKVITGSQYQGLLDCSEKDENWSDADTNGWYYYKLPLGPGESTGSYTDSLNYVGFVVNVEHILTQDFQNGANINVDVVYETTPIMYLSNGEAESWDTADIWTRNVAISDD